MATPTTKKTTGSAGAKSAAKPASKAATKPAAKTAAAKPAPRPKVVATQGVLEPGVVVEKANVELKLKDLIEKITAQTEAKKPVVRAVTEAVLREMGDALSAGQVLNLPGFGKARVARAIDAPGGTMTIKLRRAAPGMGKPGAADKGAGTMKTDDAPPLAEPGEDD